jgi:glycosyltransferase involved in cell wall biosynthesis
MKISIIIISFNQCEFLEETIISAISQTYNGTEVILIDGGSTDGSINIINKYKNNFSYWVSEKDNGQSDAIIKGFNNSKGEIITWINSDDILCLNAAEMVVKTAKINNTTKAVFYGDSYIVNMDGRIQEKLKYGKFNYFIARTLGPTISQPGTFFSKSAYFEIGGLDITLRYGMDLDLFCNFLFSNVPFLYTGVFMSKFRKYPAQKGHSEKFLEICNLETDVINKRYLFNLQTIENVRKARLLQIIERLWNGYYLSAFCFRLFMRGRLKEFNTSYSS